MMKSNNNSKTMFLRTAFFISLICLGFIFSSATIADDDGHSQPVDASSSLHQKQLHDLAANGSASAQYKLGALFEYGRGVKQDDSVALFWYEKSAAQYYADAQYRLAVLYDYGWGPASDKKKALKHYIDAAENGHALAQHDLAIMYFKGTDAPKSVLQAYKWLKIAVIGGNPLMHKHLRLVAKEMSSDEIEVAEYLAEIWVEQFDEINKP